jgi:hypothetical protein
MSAPTNYPRLNSQWFNNFCQLGPRPLVVTGWFKYWLQGHFGSAATMESTAPSIVRNLWKPNNLQTKIAIESVTAWTPELTEHRPAIIIKRNGWKRIRLGIDDRMMGTQAPSAQNQYCNLWQCSHTLFCITGEGAETELLAAEVFRELNEFGPVVRQILDLMRFEVMEVGEVMKLPQNARENFVVPITVAYAYREDWEVISEAPFLKRFVIDLATFQP